MDRRPQISKYRHHKSTNRAVVTLDGLVNPAQELRNAATCGVVGFL